MFEFVVILSLFLAQYASGQPEVKVEQGTLKGVFTESITHRKISSFLGVPYAQPPIGNLRFREPQDPLPWPGEWNATQLPPDCLQYNQLGGVIQGSEDCLYLSVFVPEEPTTHKELLDVVVNIHGGAFMFFSSSFYGPEYLLNKDVILVNVNYRLGILGFLSTGDEVVPGNNGLKDQLAALKWVQKNIKSFGGDPNKVTLVGLSAGGVSTHYHVISPKSKGLFQKAISMSGSVLCGWGQAESVREKAALIADRLGCPTDSSVKMVECLKERPGHHLVDIKALTAWLNYPFTPFGPVVEPSHPDAFIDQPPSTYIKNNLFNDVPIIFSLAADEGLWPGAEFLVDPNKMKHLDDNWNAVAPHVLDFNFTVPISQQSEISDKINLEYFGDDDIKISNKALIELMGDRHFNVPVSVAAKLQAARSKSPVYTMLFSYIGATGLQDLYGLSREIYPGTSHGDDLAYVLRASYNVHDLDPEAMMVSKRMVDLWFDFITGKEMPEGWKPLKESLPSYSYMNIGSYSPTKDNFVVEEDFGRAKFWLSLNILEDGMEKRVHEEL